MYSEVFSIFNVYAFYYTGSSYYCRFSFVINFFIIYLAANFLSSFVVKQKKLFNIISIICTLFTCCELFYGSYQTFVNGYHVSADSYNQYASAQKECLKDIQQTDNSVFYRIDQTSSWRTDSKHFAGNFYEGLAYGFMPLSSYSSTYNNDIMTFYNNCGYSACNRLITWCEPILSSDSLLGIKYVLSDYSQPGYQIASNMSYNDKMIYENPYALGIGYKTSDDILSTISSENEFEYQNELLSKIVGHTVKCYKKCTSQKLENEDGYTWIINSPKHDAILYGYCTNVVGNRFDLYIDDVLRTNYSM